MNEEKFSGMADVYAKYRPAYAASLYDFLYSELGFSTQSTIADIGAGTGKFCKPLLERGSNVICVEPNADMFRQLNAELSIYNNMSAKCCSAEHTALASNSIDFITVAQAFHWFDPVRFLAEAKRILKPQGLVVLIWNVRDHEADIVKQQAEINKKYCPAFTGFSGGFGMADPSRFSGFYRDGVCFSKAFQNDLLFHSKESFIGRGLSSSYALKRGDPAYEDFVAALSQLFDAHQSGGALVIPNASVAYWGEV